MICGCGAKMFMSTCPVMQLELKALREDHLRRTKKFYEEMKKKEDAQKEAR